MDATTQITPDRRRGAAPFLRPVGIFTAEQFTRNAKCRNGHKIAPNSRAMEMELHSCPELYGRHRVGDRFVGPFLCGQLTWVWRIRGGGAFTVPLRREEAEWFQAEGATMSPTDVLSHLSLGEQLEKAVLYLADAQSPTPA